MAMTLDEMRQLDPKQIGSWPLPVQIGVLLIVMGLLIGLGYFQIWAPQLEQIDAGKAKEEELKQVYLDKKARAVNLDAYKQQLLEIEQSFGAMLKQLPKKSEVDALLTEINQVGLGRGLHFQLFKFGSEEMKTETAELPVSIKIAGSYHDLAAFTSDVAQLSRIVTLGDMSLEPDKEFGMLLGTTARTYRYLDAEEALAVKKANKEKDKKAGGK